MPIEFHCEHCGKLIKAPDESAGRRGKCPYCQQSNYIPQPVDESELPPLEPEDEGYEKHRREEVERLLRLERDVQAERDGEAPGPPLEQRDDVAPEDVHHFVVNFCVALADGKLEKADQHARKLRRFRGVAEEAVLDFQNGKVEEPALNAIPPRVLKGMLKELQDRLKA